MSIINMGESLNKSDSPKKRANIINKITDDMVIKHTGIYDYIDTRNEGIKRVVSNQGGYLVFLDYGKVYKLNRKTNIKQLKSDKTIKHVNTEAEAKQLRAEAEEIRKRRKEEGPEAYIQTHKQSKVTLSAAIKDFKTNGIYRDFTENYQEHYDNYLRHAEDYLGDIEPCKITTIDINNYYRYQLDRGQLPISKKNKDGTVNKKEGICVNTVGKHKTALKRLWEFMILDKKYGVTENVVLLSTIPKVEVIIDDKVTYKRKIEYNPISLDIDELNYTLNDAMQNEFDRSIAAMIALCSIGGLRRSELMGLQLGKMWHDDRMSVHDDIFEVFGYDKQYYIDNPRFMMIDSGIMNIRAKKTLKLPKGEKVRIVAVPDILSKIIDYALEQRQQLYDILGKCIDNKEYVYLPLINILRNKVLVPEKVTRKWMEYQDRRNKRMIALGLEPIPVIRLHDLRHTHANVLKRTVPTWEISNNMGHVLINGNTTEKRYWDDRKPFRDDIINYFDSNIKIDWDKVMKRAINDSNNRAWVSNNGQLVIGDADKKYIMSLRKRFIMSESEMIHLLGSSKEES